MEMLIRYLPVPLVLASLLLLPLIGRAILGPVSRAAGLLCAPTRFQLSDFIWLLVIIQAALGVTVRVVGVETRGAFEVVLIYLIFAGIGIWSGAISFLSRAAVTDPYRRAAFTLLILPGTLAIMIGIPAVLILTCTHVANRVMTYGLWPFEIQEVAIVLAAIPVAVVAIPLLIALMRKAAQWVVREAQLEHPEKLSA